MLLNCDVGEDSWALLDYKDIKPVHPKGNQSWVFIGRTDAELKLQYFGRLIKKLTPWKRPWCWKRLKAGGEGDDRGWDGWMASLTQWTWVWACSGSWWWTGKPGMLQFMGLHRIRHDWATELTWIDEFINKWKHESFLLLKVYCIHLGIEKVVSRSLMGLSLFYNSVRHFSLYLLLFTNWCERINTLAF